MKYREGDHRFFAVVFSWGREARERTLKKKERGKDIYSVVSCGWGLCDDFMSLKTV